MYPISPATRGGIPGTDTALLDSFSKAPSNPQLPMADCSQPAHWSGGVVRTWGTNCRVSDIAFCHSPELLETFPEPLPEILRWSSVSVPETPSIDIMAVPKLEPATTKSLAHPPQLSRFVQQYTRFQYMDLHEVFSKAQTVTLTPRYYDCTIELLPGTCPPHGRLYSLSPATRDQPCTNTSKKPRQRVHLSFHLIGKGRFFFFEKKDGGLQHRLLGFKQYYHQEPIPSSSQDHGFRDSAGWHHLY